MGKNTYSGGGAVFGKPKKPKRRKFVPGPQQGDSDEEIDEEIPRREARKIVPGHQQGDSDEEIDENVKHEGGNAVKRNKRSGRKTRRKSSVLRVYGKKKSKTRRVL